MFSSVHRLRAYFHLFWLEGVLLCRKEGLCSFLPCVWVDAARTFAMAVVVYPKDCDILEVATVCKTAFRSTSDCRDVANSWKLSVQLRLLTESTGAEALAEEKKLDTAEDLDYSYRHVAAD